MKHLMIENQKVESLFLRQRTLLYILGIICVFYCLERAIIPGTLLFSTIVGTTAGLIPSVIAATVIRFSFDSTDKENLSLKIENLLIKKNFVKCSISNNETRFKRNTHFLLDWHPG